MHFRQLLLSALIAAALSPAAPAAPAKTAAPPSRPNILFIMVDDLGPEWISCYGGQEMKTPHVDRLAAGGMRFTNTYSMPQCTPTRATLLTGQYPFRHGWCNHWDVPRWGAGCHFDWKHNVSFARVMKQAGYVTAAAGKWQINDFRVQPDAMKRHGFDHWCMWTGYETGNPPSGKRYWDPYIYSSTTPSKTYAGKFGPDIFTDFLIDFMERNRDRPMMLYYPMVLTHGPLVHTPLNPKARTGKEKHRAMVRSTDELVGRLVAALERLKLRERTIVIFTTDNGTSRGISGRMSGRLVRGGKARLTENGPRQPFIVSGPGIVPAGVVTDALTDFTDLLPTFAELGGAKLPEGVTLDGKSIAPVILGRDQQGPREWICAMGFGPALLDSRGVRPRQKFTDRVIRDKRYKIFVIDGRVTRLHDLQKDPGETNNLIDSRSPSHQAAKARLTAALATMPAADARPRYDPTPPQPWDKKPKSGGQTTNAHQGSSRK